MTMTMTMTTAMAHTIFIVCHFLGSLRVPSLPPTHFCSIPIYFSLLCMPPTHTSNFYSTNIHGHTHTRRKYQIHLICILHGWVIIVISNEGSLNSGNIIMGHKYLVQFSTHFRYSFFLYGHRSRYVKLFSFLCVKIVVGRGKLCDEAGELGTIYADWASR